MPCVQKPQPTPDSRMASNSHDKVHTKLCETLWRLPPFCCVSHRRSRGKDLLIRTVGRVLLPKAPIENGLPDNSAPTWPGVESADRLTRGANAPLPQRSKLQRKQEGEN